MPYFAGYTKQNKTVCNKTCSIIIKVLALNTLHLHQIQYAKNMAKSLLVIRFMADLLRKYRGSVVIMVGRGGAEPHYVNN